jgi:hypothetical protein
MSSPHTVLSSSDNYRVLLLPFLRHFMQSKREQKEEEEEKRERM